MDIDTPCTAVCFIDPKTSLCLGCGRTIAEISRWHEMMPVERRTVMAALPQRMRDAGLPQPTPQPKRTAAT